MDNKIICSYCNKEFSKYGVKNHIAAVHEGNVKRVKNAKGHFGKTPWNKGLTKESDSRLQKTSKTYKERFLSGEIKRHDIKHTEETKSKISKSMKVAHKEGKAWNIGKSRWNSEPSYPEKFFIKVIENEFQDKAYEREYNVGIYSLDFAWKHLKKCIEIDGEQHQRFEEYKNRDKRKDKFLIESGWEVLRIDWKNLFNDTKKYIEIAKDFINK